MTCWILLVLLVQWTRPYTITKSTDASPCLAAFLLPAFANSDHPTRKTIYTIPQGIVLVISSFLVLILLAKAHSDILEQNFGIAYQMSSKTFPINQTSNIKWSRIYSANSNKEKCQIPFISRRELIGINDTYCHWCHLSFCIFTCLGTIVEISVNSLYDTILGMHNIIWVSTPVSNIEYHHIRDELYLILLSHCLGIMRYIN